MTWKKALQRLTLCYDRVVLADQLEVSHRDITMALRGTAKNVNAQLKRNARKEVERLRRDHVAAHEVAIYAIQMGYQLRDADSEERRDEILRRCLPVLERKSEQLMDVGEGGAT
jgi:imidazoleglycerol phosphate synthase glutamine amidotransferase subunit HisH